MTRDLHNLLGKLMVLLYLFSKLAPDRLMASTIMCRNL